MTAREQGQPDDYASGVNGAGEAWSVARYGTLIVAVMAGRDDDVQHATEAKACREFAELVAAWSTGSGDAAG